MALSEEIKKKITDASVLAEIENLESELNNVTRESISRKTKIREFESSHKATIDKIKALGLDPDQDLEEQLNQRIEAGKKGTKPESEFEALSKTVKKLSDEIGGWKTKAEQAEHSAQLERARSAFSGKLTDTFGKASDLILDYAMMKGMISVRDGVPGVIHEDDFVPLTVEKGKNAIDVLKQVYPDFAIVKQKPGSPNVNTKPANGSDGSAGGKVIAISDFEALPHAEKAAFVKEGGKVE